jgi:hypothetical protein
MHPTTGDRYFALLAIVLPGYALMGFPPLYTHMNILARAGVPGVVLWLLLISWGVMMLKAMFVARSRRHEQWVGLFLFISCYATSVVINASVDVVLEGPMQGMWFCCLFGFGIVSVMVYRAQVASEEGDPGG